MAILVGLVLLIGAAVGVYAYDQGREDTIADGVRVGGVDVGGMQRQAAAQRLREELLDPLQADVVVRARGQRHTLTADVARIRADVTGMVDEALRRSRDGNVLSRSLRSLTGGEVEADIEPEVSYSRTAVSRLVERVERNVERQPRNARVEFKPDGFERVRSRVGVRLDKAALREDVESALLQPDRAERTVRAKTTKTQPEVTTAELSRRYGTIITINRGAFRLSLYKRLKLVKTYPIAVGQVGLETPAGMYKIQNKAINPAWSVPNSAWAGDLAGTVVPGGTPQNPLKARWMGIYNGAGIHGTDAAGSIGSNASHGCIRMLIPDVIELYDEVEVGAQVYIA
jgi:lipoprotein-anchoring transpeptidase ErfK/SrfK